MLEELLLSTGEWGKSLLAFIAYHIEALVPTQPSGLPQNISGTEDVHYFCVRAEARDPVFVGDRCSYRRIASSICRRQDQMCESYSRIWNSSFDVFSPEGENCYTLCKRFRSHEIETDTLQQKILLLDLRILIQNTHQLLRCCSAMAACYPYIIQFRRRRNTSTFPVGHSPLSQGIMSPLFQCNTAYSSQGSV